MLGLVHTADEKENAGHATIADMCGRKMIRGEGKNVNKKESSINSLCGISHVPRPAGHSVRE